MAALGPCLAHCAPHFDELFAGSAGTSAESIAGSNSGVGGAPGGAGASNQAGVGGVGGVGGASGVPHGSESGGNGALAGGATVATGGEQATSALAGGGASDGGESDGGMSIGGATDSGGTSIGGASNVGGAGDQGGAGGASPEPKCVTTHAGQLGYNDFDAALTSPFFPDAVGSAFATGQGSACTVNRDSKVGKTCAGSLHVLTAFAGYAPGSVEDDKAFGQIDFSLADWSNAAAVHVAIKVLPADAPITGVRMFLLSGTDYAYDAIFDSDKFKNGDWYELVFPLAGTSLDLSKVRRLGVQLTLDRAKTPSLPMIPPAIDLWMDDVWIEAGKAVD